VADLRIVSLRVGRPKTYVIPGAEDPAHEVFTSAIGKEPVAGPVWLDRHGLAGDEVADHRAHGGPEQAVLAYAASHYPRWCAEWGRAEVPIGSFGENLTVAGADEESVCLGDQWAIGDALLEVSKPRSPCNRVAWHNRRDDLMRRIRATGRSGWYLRVLTPGALEVGAPVVLAARSHPELTVRLAAAAMANREREPREAIVLLNCPALAADWRYRLAKEGFRRDRLAEHPSPSTPRTGDRSMQLVLDDRETVTLRELLEAYLPELQREIARTEQHDLRHVLVRRQELGERLLDQLQRGPA
jgi:MOSC domain-containing protein YiiM